MINKLFQYYLSRVIELNEPQKTESKILTESFKMNGMVFSIEKGNHNHSMEQKTGDSYKNIFLCSLNDN